jgi:hypothetical protein
MLSMKSGIGVSIPHRDHFFAISHGWGGDSYLIRSRCHLENALNYLWFYWGVGNVNCTEVRAFYYG